MSLVNDIIKPEAISALGNQIKRSAWKGGLMAKNVVKNPAQKKLAPSEELKPAPRIEGIVARSANRGGVEDAWVSIVTGFGEPVLVVEFKSLDYGSEAWARSVKYGRRFAERLRVEFRKKRGV